jgi:hypothetical protein
MVLPWFKLSRGAKEQENTKHWIKLTLFFFILELVSRIGNFWISDLIVLLNWNIKCQSVQNWKCGFCCCFCFLSYSESFSFQAWEKKFLEKNPMSLLMIWVSMRILTCLCNIIIIWYSNLQLHEKKNNVWKPFSVNNIIYVNAELHSGFTSEYHAI